jgi:hypothetical protein
MADKVQPVGRARERTGDGRAAGCVVGVSLALALAHGARILRMLRYAWRRTDFRFA